MKALSFLFIILLFSSFFACQTATTTDVLDWQVLAQVTYETQYDSTTAGFQPIQSPKFSAEILAFEGKYVTIKGYLIPMEESGRANYFVLSALPFNLCYFCGGAGPETLIEVRSQEAIPFDTEPIVLKGIFRTYAQTQDYLMYQLHEATVVKP
ncbi:MAG: hypothetical protein EAZ55_07230 [Cytophagales bacterium]|nr:MAG: hypothetical protein EAZ55_07230 [Cytophagales bacterium]